MNKINTRVLVPALTIIMGIVWVVYGLTNYGWWDEGPGSGFFPSIVGVLISGVSLIALLEGLKLEAPKYIKDSFHPFLAAISTVLAAMVIGFFPAMFLFLQGWLKLYEKMGWKKSLSISIITTVLLYGIFAMWLMVPFPAGIIVDAIRG